MRKKSIFKLSTILVLIAVIGYIALKGFAVGVYDINSLPSIVKQGLDLTGGVSIVYQATNTSIEDFDSKMDSAVVVFRNRLDSKGFTEATIVRQGTDRIRVEIPINDSSTIKDPNEISEFIGTPAVLQYFDPSGNEILNGSDIEKAYATYQNGKYVVIFQMNDDGANKISEATKNLIGQDITIKLDGVTISTATVEGVLGKSSQISGSFTLESAKNLALQLQSGALPLELEEIEARSISATLGDDALQTSITAGIIGIVLILVFMLVIYRVCGLAADIALTIYMLIVLFAVATIQGVQLTLPGIAGLILGVGMAVDANVIIFERFKEELRNGKPLRSALDAGFKRAYVTIIDSNITTVIAALVLFWLGTGPIKGFAITLLIGVVTSFITAVFVTKYILKLIIGLGIEDKKLFIGIGGQKDEEL